MASVRQTRSGRWELCVRHQLLPRPFYSTFDDRAGAEAYGAQLEGLLGRGIVPVELQAAPADKRASPLVVAIVRAYLAEAPVRPSEAALLATLVPELAGLRLDHVTTSWARAWVSEMKAPRPPLPGQLKPRAHLAPGSIRKRVGALARVLDWHLANSARAGRVDGGLAVNPLRLLGHGYSAYTAHDEARLARLDLPAKIDEARDLRVEPDAEARILAALAGHKRPDRERPIAGADAAELRLLYLLIVHTGLRLREAYTLRVADIDLERRTINVRGTNKGRSARPRLRQVPIVRELLDELRAHCQGRVGLLFGWWDGRPESLDGVSARLSQRFTALFAYADCPELREHDLRHEATCRWVMMRDAAGRWMYSETEVCRIMGWRDPRMMLRYASLRGTDLAERLG